MSIINCYEIHLHLIVYFAKGIDLAGVDMLK
jgi:hypothetical protein